MERSTRSASRSSKSGVGAGGSAIGSTGSNFIGKEFEKTVPLFPLFDVWQYAYPATFVAIAATLDALQVVSLGLIPYNEHLSFSLKGIAQGLFVTHLPLFDNFHLQAGWIGTLVISSIAFALLILVLLGVLAYLYIGADDQFDEMFGASTTKMLGHVVSFFGTWAFIPTFENFIAVAFCDTSTMRHTWFSDVECLGAASSYSIALSVIGSVLLAACAYTVTCIVVPTDPMTRHINGVADTKLNFYYMLYRIISVALLHHFKTQGQMLYFSVWMAISSLVLAIAFVYYIPFYRLSGQRIRVWSLLSASALAILSCALYSPDVQWSVAEYHLDLIILAVIALPFSWVFIKIAHFRTSSIFLDGLRALENGVVDFNVHYFPRGLPEEDEVTPESVAIADMFTGEEFEDFDANDDDYHFTLPYVNEISCAEDVELATRFLIFARKCTNDTTDHQLAFAAKVFTKGLALYRGNPVLRFNFINFLASHAGQPKVAHSQLNVLNGVEAPLWVRYNAYVANNRISSLLNAKSSSRLASYARAKKRHHDALQSTIEFWSLLLNDDVDKDALSSVTRDILSAKSEVLHTYNRLLEKHSSSMEIVATYASFCETVLQNDEATSACDTYLRELREMKQSSAMRGAKGRAAKDKETLAQLPLYLDEEDEGNEDDSSTNSNLMQGFYVLLVLLILLTCAVGAFVGTQAQFNETKDRKIESVYRAGVLRGLLSQAAVAAYDYRVVATVNTSTTAVQSTGNRLLSIQSDMRTLYNTLSIDEHRASISDHRDFYRAGKFRFEDDGAQISFWALGGMAIVALRDLYDKPTTSSHYEWIVDDLPFFTGKAFNESLQLYVDTFEQNQSTKEGVSAAVIVASVALVVAIVMVVKYYTSRIDSARRDIFSLFTLVPRSVIKRLVRYNRKTMNKVDEFFAMKSKQKVVARIGAVNGEENELTLVGDDDGLRHNSLNSGSKMSGSAISATNSDSDASSVGGSQVVEGMPHRRRRDKTKTLEKNLRVGATPETIFRAWTVFIVATILLSVTAAALQLPERIRGAADGKMSWARFRQDFDRASADRILATNSFTLTGSEYSITRLVDFRANDYLPRAETWLLSELPSPLEMSKFFDAVFVDQAMAQLEDIAVFLAAPTFPDGFVFGTSRHLNYSRTEFSNVSWTQETLRSATLLTSLRIPEFDLTFLGTRAEADTWSDAQKLTVARRIASSELYNSLYLRQHNLIKDIKLTHSAEARIMAENMIVALTVVALVGSLVFLVLGVQAIREHRRNHHLQTPAAAIQMLLILIALILTITTSVSLANQVEHRFHPFDERADAVLDMAFDWQEDLVLYTLDPREFIGSGNYLSMLHYREHFIDKANPRIKKWETHLRELPDRGPIDAHEIDHVREAQTRIATLGRLNRIGLVMGLGVHVDTALTAAINTSFASITWNITAEPDFRWTNATYGGSEMLYSDRAADLARPTAELQKLAIQTVHSRRYTGRYDKVADFIGEEANRLWNLVLDFEREWAQEQEQLQIVTLALAAIAAVAAAAAGIEVFYRYQANAGAKLVDSSSKKGGSHSSAAQTQNTSWFSAANMPYVVLSLILVLLVTVGILVGVEIHEFRKTPRLINLGTKPLVITGESMLIAKRMNDVAFVAEGQRRLQTQLHEVYLTMRELYFDNSNSYFGVAQDTTQDELLFDRRAASATNLFSTCNATRGSEIGGQLERGVGLLFGQQWSAAIRGLAFAPEERVPEYIAAMESTYDAMVAGASMSAERYRDNELEKSRTWNVAIMAIAIATMVVAFVSIIGVFRPFIAHLANEEGGARLMIKIIPEDAMEKNSQIAAFLESGNVGKSDSDGINDAITNMSSVPVVAIDMKGTILRFTHAAEEVFGYKASEVLGSNVKMLMPKEFATNHDTYLANYRRTKVKHIIDTTRRVAGLKKDGLQVPLDVSVTELIFSEEESVYIAFLKDVTSELELALQDKLNRYITDLSKDPIISIDHLGTILSCNQATTSIFGYTREEMLRENIKMLMPSDIALNHDGYLKRYLETGVKHVIDTTRNVMGQRKNGDVFHALVMVKEIRGGLGEPPTYIGFVIDNSADYNAKVQNALNDTISDLSPIPIMAINEKGQFVKFSRAAANLLGYNREDVIANDRNIQMIVPPKYGDHTKYMDRYFKTGVKTVIDRTRTVSAIRRDGTEFACELTVKEISKTGMPPVFLAYMVDITQSLAVRESATLAETIVYYSMIPVIHTDYFGIVTLFNSASELAFGWKADDIVGQNVKLLTPDSIAAKHDGFLEAYRRTREKHVIDTNRTLTAKRKDGTFFTAELAVKEVPPTENDPGSFFAYIRDITQHRATLQQFMINDVISSLSTVPIIAISSKGIVEAFNLAAEECFGWSAADVLGENVKMLMPNEIAIRHDAILAKYRETGVKHVIDTTRVVTAKRKDNAIFPLEISVREIKKEGQDSSYVGYARDMSNDAILQEQEKFGRTVRDLSSIPIVQTDKFGIITYVNDALATEFGYKPDELVKQNVKILLPDKFAETHDEYVTRFRENPNHSSSVVGKIRRLIGKRKDGSTFEVEAKIQDIRSKRSDMFVLIGFLRNLETQLKLEQANRTIDTLTNLSTVPIIAIDSRGVVIKFSTAAEKVWGWAHGEVEGNNIKMLMPDHIAEKHDSYLKTYHRTGVKTVVDSVLTQDAKRRNGDLFPVELAIKEVKKQGQESLFIGYVRDATEDNALQVALEQSRVITAASPLPIIVTNRRGIVTTFNNAALELFGFTESDIVGRSVNVIMTEEDAKYHDKYLKMYAKTRVKSAIDAVRKRTAVRRDGTKLPVEISVREIVPASNDMQLVSYLAFVRDLTADRILQQAGMVNDSIASMVAIPLIAISSRGDILRFSESAEKCFGYSQIDVVGKNVKMLMPENIAQNHDMYLQNYFARKTETEVVFTRKVRPKRANGEIFPANLTVREVRKSGQESMFVGFLEDQSKMAKTLMQKTIVETAIQMSDVPLVMIDPEGTVVQFNGAAEECFGYTKRDVVGNNVKMLMPRSTADQHDMYLSNYAVTGVKTVVDTVRNVTGKRRDGRKFPLEISVREIKEGKNHYFVGYLRDISNMFAMQKATAISEAVIELSSSPLIAINDKGTIEMFSTAAERAFGYVRSEAIGENVKMLMPDQWASKHDDYLTRYRTTGEPHAMNTVTSGLRGLNKDGTEFPIQLRLAEIKTDHATTYLAMIKERKEDLRLEVESHLGAAALELTDRSLIMIDDHGIIQNINTAACDMLQYNRSELINQNLKMLMPQEVARQHDGYLKRYRDTGVKHVIDTERAAVAQCKSGLLRQVVLHIREFKKHDGRSLFVGYVSDEDERKREGYCEMLSNTLMELISIPIIAIDKKGEIIQVNRATEDVFEFTKAQLLGRNVKILMPEETQREHDTYLENYFRTGEKHVIDSTSRVRAEKKSGDLIEVEISIREIKTKQQHFFVGYLNPIEK